MPSNHVWASFESPGFPHLLNQAPPGAQQLGFPDFLRMPHLRHSLLFITEVRVLVAIVTSASAKTINRENAFRTTYLHEYINININIYVNDNRGSTKMCLLLHVCMPSNHVWSNFESPGFPHLLNQVPPGAQQLRFPDFLRVPHFRHSLLFVAVLVAIVMWGSAHKKVSLVTGDMNAKVCNRWHCKFYTLTTFAGQDTLEPRMIKVGVTIISTLFEPSATANTTTSFAGFFDNATLATCIVAYVDGRRTGNLRGSWKNGDSRCRATYLQWE